jgi:DNA-binding response OmpR family regulator
MPKKILIVDDEPNILVSLQFLMHQRGYEVMTATSGEEAIEIIMKFQPHLILLDVMLPGIDGFEVCEIVRLDPKWRDIKIIFLSAKGQEEDIAKGMVLGADDYITKPYGNKDVTEKVRVLLGSDSPGSNDQ